MESGRVRVLIVDDQDTFRQVAHLVVDLTDGFEVVGEAEDGETSVDMARALNPDLVLMDVNLPGIDGLEATRRILAALDDVEVVVLSTYEPDEYAPRAAAAGAIAYIPKSTLDPETLEAAWLAGAAT
ncbi:MAG TPA: response regulator transcription factor [Egibacteraceae bacterium]|nr:response regulator transcription factor [Egibacteraceae bacterium]